MNQPPEKNGIERRRHKRYPITLQVGVFIRSRPEEIREGQIQNISISGALVKCDIEAEVGDELVVALKSNSANYLSGIVTMAREVMDRTLPPGIPPSAVIRWAKRRDGYGIEFQNLDDTSKQFLTQLIAHLDAEEQKSPRT